MTSVDIAHLAVGSDTDLGSSSDVPIARASRRRPGREFPGVGVAALVRERVDHETVVALLRRGAHGAGTWTVPGGWVEYGEDPLQAVVREVEEETGLYVRPDHPLPFHVTNDVFADEGVHSVTLWYECRVTGGRLRPREPDRAVVGARLTWDELDGLPLFLPLRTLRRERPDVWGPRDRTGRSRRRDA